VQSSMTSHDKLVAIYGLLMHSRDVQVALRFKSLDSLRSARYRGRLRLDMFPIPGRRGLFARTEDVASLMASFHPASDQSPAAGPPQPAEATCNPTKKGADMS
jgi:hypothetical protein